MNNSKDKPRETPDLSSDTIFCSIRNHTFQRHLFENYISKGNVFFTLTDRWHSIYQRESSVERIIYKAALVAQMCSERPQIYLQKLSSYLTIHGTRFRCCGGFISNRILLAICTGTLSKVCTYLYSCPWKSAL
jgi:hypothetical protein